MKFFFSGWNFFFFVKIWKMFLAGVFFWDDLDVQFQLQLNSIAKRKKCHLAKGQFFYWNTFFQKNVKKNIFWRVEGGSRKLFFTILQMVSLIFCPKLSYKAKIPLIDVNKKKPGGVNFFHFLRVQIPYVHNFGFGKGVLVAIELWEMTIIVYTAQYGAPGQTLMRIQWRDWTSCNYSMLRFRVSIPKAGLRFKLDTLAWNNGMRTFRPKRFMKSFQSHVYLFTK